MVYNNFYKALKSAGFNEITISYIRNEDCYVYIKVCPEEDAKKFEQNAKTLGFKYRVRRYENGMNIWVFRAYNKGK